MDNPFAVLSEDDTKGEVKMRRKKKLYEDLSLILLKFFRFQGLVPDVKIVLKDSNFQSDRYRKSSSLLTISSKYGFFIVGSLKGIHIYIQTYFFLLLTF